MNLLSSAILLSVGIKFAFEEDILTPVARELSFESYCGRKMNFKNNLACLFSNDTDDIPPIEEKKPSYTDDSIFFIETSCTGMLNFRQACSVEAAARAHPRRDINVLFAGPMTTECLKASPLSEILAFDNVNLYRVYIKKYLKGTPLYFLVKNGKFNHSQYPVTHIYDLLRIVTLYKYGGVYLDLDVMVAKPLEYLWEQKNWVGRKDEKDIDTAILALSKYGVGHYISHKVMKILKHNYDLLMDSWDHNCIDVILTKVLSKFCVTTEVDKMSATTCKGFEVYPPEYFYPIKYWEWGRYFTKNHEYVQYEPFAYHLWNYLSHNEAILEGSLYAKLMKTFCPSVYQIIY